MTNIVEIPNTELNVTKIAMHCDKCINDSKGRSFRKWEK